MRERRRCVTEPETQPYLFVYSIGFVYLSCCASESMGIEEVEEAVNARYPSGVTPWRIADEPFKNGAPNPCECELDPSQQHWLLVC
jgi:hypothetical protein